MPCQLFALDEDVLLRVVFHLSPSDATVACSTCSSLWFLLAGEGAGRSVWRTWCQEAFSAAGYAPTSGSLWRVLYASCRLAEAEWQRRHCFAPARRVIRSGQVAIRGYWSYKTRILHLLVGVRAEMVPGGCNDTFYYAHHPPSKALAAHGTLSECWRTSPGSGGEDGAPVHLLVRLPVACLLVGVGVVTPPWGYPHPVCRVDVYASMSEETGRGTSSHVATVCFRERQIGTEKIVGLTTPVACTHVVFLLKGSHSIRRGVDEKTIDVSKLQLYGLPIGNGSA